jgi:hypothetical protein
MNEVINRKEHGTPSNPYMRGTKTNRETRKKSITKNKQ